MARIMLAFCLSLFAFSANSAHKYEWSGVCIEGCSYETASSFQMVLQEGTTLNDIGYIEFTNPTGSAYPWLSGHTNHGLDSGVITTTGNSEAIHLFVLEGTSYHTHPNALTPNYPTYYENEFLNLFIGFDGNIVGTHEFRIRPSDEIGNVDYNNVVSIFSNIRYAGQWTALDGSPPVPSIVPLPSSALLFGSALLLLNGVRRSRKFGGAFLRPH